MNESYVEGSHLSESGSDIKKALDQVSQLKEECSKILIGQEDLLELLLIGILCEGHILLEGVPGIAKTLTAKVLAKSIDTAFSRIQFTPDLMPADIIGTSVFNLKNSEFEFRKGPIFSNLVLIDEINRAPAKTQSALFEVMEEKQVTFDGVTYMLDSPFMVIATQNPIEHEGTYRLPEGQLDRFLMKIILKYPGKEDEIRILEKFKSDVAKPDLTVLRKVLDKEVIKYMQHTLSLIHVEPQMLEYIVNLVQETRNHGHIFLGASPRAALAILKSSKAVALFSGRDFVIPDDVKFVSPYVLNHRIILTPMAEMEGVQSWTLIEEILRELEIPR